MPSSQSNIIKLRLLYLFLMLATITVGLATRKFPELFSNFLAEFGGDTLWATLFFFVFRFVFIQTSIVKLAGFTYLFCVLIELSQLYQADWINSLRKTFVGQMLLGHGFLWSDLLAYAAGVLLGILIAYLVEASVSAKSSTSK